MPYEVLKEIIKNDIKILEENNDKILSSHLKMVLEVLDDVIPKTKVDQAIEEIQNTYFELPSDYNHHQRTKLYYEVIKILNRLVEKK